MASITEVSTVEALDPVGPQRPTVEQHSLPRAPQSIKETGLSLQFIQRLVLKTMHVIGSETLEQIGKQTRLSSTVIAEVMEDARELGLVIPMGSTEGNFLSEMRFNLSGKGTEWAEDALRYSQYVGPCPVPMSYYDQMVATQTVLNERIDETMLARSFEGIVLPPEIFRRLGPAANSGKSMLLYGKPGNGKTMVAEAMGRAYAQSICVPHAVEVDGQIIKVLDDSIHRPVNGSSSHRSTADISKLSLRKSEIGDSRWVRCYRPVVITGGELTLDMLDLRYNDTSRFYEAPLQMKATGGIFVIDDFGRQRTSPHSILNRWIVPLERRIDYLTLHSGKKFQVPFDELVVFSTNIKPKDLGDDALLRRLYHKVEIPLPTDEDFRVIFENACAKQCISFDPSVLEFLNEEFYAKTSVPRSGYHPQFLLDQIRSYADFTGRSFVLNKENLRIAWENILTVNSGAQ